MQPTEQLEMVKGLTLSFGLTNICRVVDIFDAGGQQEIISKADGTAINLYQQEAPIMDMFSENQE